MVIGPGRAPAGTAAVSSLLLVTVKSAGTPPANFTEVTPFKFVPVIVICDPTTAVDGVTLLMVGQVEPQQTACRRAISSCQQPRVPVSPAKSSVTRNFQVPFTGLPLRVDSAASGRKSPAKGAIPPEIETVAESLKTVN